MPIDNLTQNVEIIQTLGTFPNQDDGFTPEELKQKFDEGAKIIKEYINNVIVPSLKKLQEDKPEDGYSPQVRTEPIDGGYRVEIDYRDEAHDGALTTAIFEVKDGQKPVAGEDYFTQEDKKEIVDMVLSSIKNAEEVAY